MPQICVLNESSADDADVAFAVKACDTQLREHFCPRFPEIPYQPVGFYKTKQDLPTFSGVALICSIIDGMDVQGAAAYHGFLGVPYIKVDRKLGVLSVLMSHEFLEESANPVCLERRILPSGVRVAYEVADPVEGWTYAIPTELFGETRQVSVSAFVTDAWFSGGPGPRSFSDERFEDLSPGQVAPGGYVPTVSLSNHGGKAPVWGHLLGRAAATGEIWDRAKREGSRWSRITGTPR